MKSDQFTFDGYETLVLKDSVSPLGVRLTTLQVRFPRFILAEMNTHRALSRSSASSRAVPIEKMIERVLTDPAGPIEWGINRPGMSADTVLALEDASASYCAWLKARDAAVEAARELQKLGLHKQIANRVIEPFLWHTAIITASGEWENFFTLRLAANAQPEMRAAAKSMRLAMDASTPRPLGFGEWHLPFHDPDRDRDLSGKQLMIVCAARCARVSYLTHDGKRDPAKDLDLARRLLIDRHLSPFEHVAEAATQLRPYANFVGWEQLRTKIETDGFSDLLLATAS